MLDLKKRVRVSAEDYIYVSARVRAHEAASFGAEGLRALVDARDYDAAVRFLTERGPALRKNAAGRVDWEATLDAYLADAFALVEESVPFPALFSFLRIPYDCHNLKSALKASFRGEDFIRFFLPLGNFTLEELAAMTAARDFSPLPDALRRAVPEASAAFSASRDPQEIDRILDRASFAAMLEEVGRFRVKSLTALVELKIDLVNLITAIRLYRMGARTEGPFFSFFLEGGTLGRAFFADLFGKGGALFFKALLAGPFASLLPPGFAEKEAAGAALAGGALTGGALTGGTLTGGTLTGGAAAAGTLMQDASASGVQAADGPEGRGRVLNREDAGGEGIAGSLAALSPALLETRADNLYLAAAKKSAAVAYGPEVAAAFLLRREFEVKNIRFLLFAKRAGLDSAAIRERLRVL